MIIIRAIKLHDKEAYEKFAFTTHIGVTSLPKNKETLHKKLMASIDAFSKEIKTPGKEIYLFIMEDLETGKQVGTCGIYAKTGGPEPVYFFRVETLYHQSKILALPKETRILHTVSYSEGPSEICSLYILPEFRHGGHGRLLSLSRFLFIATFPERFDHTILSNMRGVIDDNDRSAFWDGFGRFFLEMEFSEVMAMIDANLRDFIPHYLPKYPVYVSLLKKSAQNAIGATHPHTKPALTMLTKEGFRATGEIDIFDGGPILSAQTDNIRSIVESKVGTIGKITTDPIDSPNYIVCNNLLDFRAAFGKVKEENQHLAINPELATALKVKVNDKIRYVTSGHEDHS